MRLDRLQLASHVAAPTNERPVLTNVCFTSKGVYSVDGFRWLFIAYPSFREHAPTMPAEADAFKLADGEQCLLPARWCARAAQLVGKHDRVSLSLVDGRARLTIASDDGVTTVETTPETGNFPDCELMIPTDEAPFQIAFAPDVFGDLMQKMALLNRPIMRFEFRSKSKIGMVTVAEGGAVVARAAVMPMYVSWPEETTQPATGLVGDGSR